MRSLILIGIAILLLIGAAQAESQDETNWATIIEGAILGAILLILLIDVIVLLLHPVGKISWTTTIVVIILALLIIWGIAALLSLVKNPIFVILLIGAFDMLLRRRKKIIPKTIEKPAPEEKSVPLSIWIEYLRARKNESSTPKNKPPQKYKISWIILIILLIVVGTIGYTIYQKYSPLAELANCGNNCVDYKKVRVIQYETSVPDIKITNADTEKMIMDVPIIIRNPSAKDTETLKIDFDVSMEGKHLTKGTIPAYELPAKQNTTILIKDVVIKYEELGEVFKTVASKHGAEMVTEGKANISMNIDLLIYFPIEVFSINIYTFTIPIQIKTDVPIDMFKQNEEAKKQIEKKIRGTIKEVQEKIMGEMPTSIPTLPNSPTSTPTPSLPTPTATPTLPLPTPTLPQFP